MFFNTIQYQDLQKYIRSTIYIKLWVLILKNKFVLTLEKLIAYQYNYVGQFVPIPIHR